MLEKRPFICQCRQELYFPKLALVYRIVKRHLTNVIANVSLAAKLGAVTVISRIERIVLFYNAPFECGNVLL